MNKRPFLFGLGVGIIIGALLLQLMIVGERQASGLDSFQKEDAGEKLYTQSELDEQLDSEREKLQAQQGSSGSV
ncbi:hypothetical protein K0U00_47290, partial [Paenibacillus sepulcri]|nr:hypothetical protein [Paenibacillus sepulcri]